MDVVIFYAVYLGGALLLAFSTWNLIRNDPKPA